MNLKKITAKLPPCMLGGGKRFVFFVQDIISDLKLFVFLLAVLFLYRVLFIYFFRAELAGSASCGDIWLALWYGFRLSLKTAAAFIIPAFVLGTLIRQVLPKWPSLKIKFYIGALEIFILSLLFQTRLPYYKEFHNAFDPFIFNTFNDDVLAIADSAVKQYNAPLRILMGLLAAAALTWLWKKWLSARLLPKNFPDGVKHKALIVWAIIIFIPVFAVYMRHGGSFNYNGSIYWKNSARMSSHLLNEAILDDVQALYKASRIHRNLRKIQNADYSPEEIRQTLSDLAGANYHSSSLLPFLEKTARGAAEKPEHIFLIIGETYMLWPMLEEYSYLGAAEGMKALASSEKGAMLKHFLPAANGTMFGLASIVWGLPEINIQGFSQASALKPYETSLAVQLKKLGYETRFFYGGFPSWENVGVFMSAQGFDKAYYKGSYAGLPANAWGTEDRYFLERTKELFDASKPSFNVILTSSNHPPLTVALSKEPEVKSEKAYAEILPPALAGDKDLISKLRHFEYSDKYISAFIKDMSAKYPNSLFIFTGDHAQRWTVNPTPGVFEKVAVPLIIYGTGVKKDIFEDGAAASHKDIAALTLELAAPKGFIYYAFGGFPSKENTGLHNVYWIKDGCVGEINGEASEPALSGKTPEECAAAAPEASAYGKNIFKAVWQRIMKGVNL